MIAQKITMVEDGFLIMQKYKEKAVPLITIDGKEQYKLGEEAQAILAATPGKIAVVAVSGMYRTGKSYLLNRMLLNRSDGFGVGPTINPCTKGLWMWGKPIVHRTSRDDILNVFIVDSEGMGACDEDNTHDSKVFALTMLLSSCFIYNSMGVIDQNAISSLGLVVGLGRFLRIRANQQSDEERSGEHSPEFYWVVRDFSLQLVNKEGSPIEGIDYLENALSLQLEKNSEIAESRNGIRKAIKQYFPRRDCITLVRPLTNEDNLQMLDRMNFQELRPEFVEQVIAFRKKVFGGLRPKTLKGKILTGKLFCDLINSYVEAVNTGGVPVIETTWQYICRNECDQALEECFDFLEASLNEKIKKRLPLSQSQLRKLRQQIVRQTSEMFERLTPNNDFSLQYRQQLIGKFGSKFNLLRQQNEAEHIKTAQAFLSGEFEYIDRRTRNSEYKRVGEYVKEIQLFYEYYRKKCASQPPKANVFVLEFLMKKLAETAVGMAKQGQLQTDGVKARLKEVEAEAEKEAVEADDRLARERALLNDKISCLESTRKELSASKESLGQQLQKARQQVKSLIQEYSSREGHLKKEASRIQTELRSRVQILEHTLDENSKDHSHIVSTLQRQQLLLQNKLDYNQKNLQEMSSRNRQVEAELRQAKSQFERILKETERSFEGQKTMWQAKLSKLDLAVEQKNIELARMEQHNADLNLTVDDLGRKLKSSKQDSEGLLKRTREQFAEDHQLQLERVKREYQDTVSDLGKRQRKLEGDLASKENSLKLVRLELQKQAALVSQKLQFCQSQLREKNDRIHKIDEDYESLMAVVAHKDEEICVAEQKLKQALDATDKDKKQFEAEISILKMQLDEAKLAHTQLSEELTDCVQKLQLVEREKQATDQVADRLKQQLRTAELSRNQTLLERQGKFQQQLSRYELELEAERDQSRLRIEQIKRNSQSSLMQLKNFYEIERERLEKRLLEQRKRIEHVESEALQMLAQQYSKYKDSSEEEIAALQESIKDTQAKQRETEQSMLMKLDQAKQSLEELQRQRTMGQEESSSREAQLRQQLRRLQKEQQEERSTFIRKVENITHEMARKQRELLQLNTRREQCESQLLKKEQQLQDLQRQCSQEMQHLTQRADQFRAKYAAMKDQYMQLKIETEKEIALTRQKVQHSAIQNEFLTTKVAELIKEREASSSKSIAERPNQRSEALKEQMDRIAHELSIAELKLDKTKKSARDTESLLTKQLSQLEREKSLLNEKLYLAEERNKELQSRSTFRGEQHMKDIDEMRERYAAERELHTAENEKLRAQLVSRQSEYDELYSRHQREVALLDEKVKFIEHQKDQLKRELEDNRRKLDLAVSQLQRRDRTEEEEQLKRKSLQLERKYSTQLESMRESLKKKTEQAEDQAARFRAQLRTAKERNSELQQRLLRGEKSKRSDELLLQQNEQLKRQRDELFLSHKAELARQNEQNRRKLGELQKKYKAVEKKNAEFNFTLEKEHAKWIMERDSLVDKITELEETLKERNFLQKSMELQRSAVEIRKASLDRRRGPLQESSSSELISPTSSPSVKRSGFFDLKLL